MKRNYLQLIILFGLLFGTVGVRADVPEYIIQATNATSLNKNSIELDMPEIAENGSVVPVGIKKLVTGKPELHVEQIWFFDQSRPRHLAVFKLTPAVDAEDIKTRVKLAKSTVIYAVARLSDGSTMIGHAPVKVTKGGC